MNIPSRIIQDLIAEIIDDVATLYKASEAVSVLELVDSRSLISKKVALVDMLWSFAHASISMIFLAVYKPFYN